MAVWASVTSRRCSALQGNRSTHRKHSIYLYTAPYHRSILLHLIRLSTSPSILPTIWVYNSLHLQLLTAWDENLESYLFLATLTLLICILSLKQRILHTERHQFHIVSTTKPAAKMKATKGLTGHLWIVQVRRGLISSRPQASGNPQSTGVYVAPVAHLWLVTFVLRPKIILSSARHWMLDAL